MELEGHGHGPCGTREEPGQGPGVGAAEGKAKVWETRAAVHHVRKTKEVRETTERERRCHGNNAEYRCFTPTS